MHELLPLFGGILLGATLGHIRGRKRLVLAFVAAVSLGFFATVVSGEYSISWDFLAVDIPGAALAFVVGAALRIQYGGRYERT